MQRFNVFAAEFEYKPDKPEGYRCGSARFGPMIGSQRISGTVYELPPGESTWPYHYEYGAEEWLIVLAGRPTLRHPGGVDELEPGETVAFPEGPDGAHKLTNRGAEPARLIILSTYSRPAVAVYPDSDKIGVWASADGESLHVQRSSDVDYWQGEA